MRTFISVELPDEIKKNVAEATGPLKESSSGIKWVETHNLHITLKFLGWVEDPKIANVIELTTKAVAGTGSFKVKFGGMGTFPPGKSPRVIWVGINEGGDKLAKLAEALEEGLSRAGYRSEEREFSSHMTIGRVKEKKGVDKVIEKMNSFKEQNFGEMVAKHISIMKSTLTPKGPVYEKIKDIVLKDSVRRR